jgi:nucleoside-diphosphate-sugar epimerase
LEKAFDLTHSHGEATLDFFITGATGYIGGALSRRLAGLGYRVSGLTRSRAGKQQLEAWGVEPVLGDLDDADLLADVALEARTVIHAADADHLESIGSLLRGLQGREASFIHTSGTGMYADAAAGEPSDRTFEETDEPALTPHKLRRWEGEQQVLTASGERLRTVVIRPSMAYGLGKSIQVPLLIDIARNSQAGRYLGRGLNRWSNVQIDDLVDLYLLAIEKAPHGALYNVASGEASIKELAESISRMLGFEGRTATMTVEEGVSFRGRDFWWIDLASNSRVSGLKARRDLDWTPFRPSILHDIEFGSYASAGDLPAAKSSGEQRA